ncbi:GNAT family N-acetyltransferase [Nocardioides sp. KC13]|uniref:GNAT family N-acetyltransferase n=1 Tax=Nocardioides turkmenicus TaxID=2711220 RepID=A0A6M1R0U6_9ACTN|nr:GNAT family N-acetyltransferase [Nocardioides sp. KC13]NGN93864.1 GNAT family N-acetyltransferase [Nocardioides sp. KC13]
MTTLHTHLDVPQPVIARLARPEDHAALRHLWLLFRHDMSGFSSILPYADGTFRSEWLDAALRSDPGWRAWILTAGIHPIGFALVRDADQPVRILNSFFVVAGARRAGLGLGFARAVVSGAPGEWAVAYQERNLVAAGFWERVTAGCERSWSETVGAGGVADMWISFTVDRFPRWSSRRSR